MTQATTLTWTSPVSHLPALGFPNATADSGAGGQFAPTVVAPRGRTVLVVDDEPTLRSLAQLVLERAGFRALTATDGGTGLRLLREHAGEVGAVLLDLELPDLGGDEVFRQLREICPGLPVVLASGHDQQAALREPFRDTLAGFLQKPFRISDLVTTIQSAVAPAV